MAETLFLLPGLLCDRITWAAQEAALADLAEIRIPSFYGFNSLELMAKSVLNVAPERFSVAGHSMGARVALEIVRLAPRRVARLALLDTGVHPVRPGEPEQRRKLVELARREGMEALAAAWLPPMVGPDRGPALMPSLVEMVCRATPGIFDGQVHALLGRRDAAPMLPGIAVPTLVATGRDDGWSPPAQHEAIAAAIPGADLVIFERSGHMAPMEAPDAVNAAMRQWMTRTRP